MAFLFSGLYEDVPDIDLYLERIDYHSDRRPTLDNLKELIKKNQTHIPYGNLDFYRNQSCPSLAIQDIFEKIIIRHGCGGCFEINLLFFAVLRSFGYGLGLPSPVVPVALDEDQDWQPAAISPNYYSYKTHLNGNNVLLEGYNGSKSMSMVSFVLQPAELVDFVPLNYYACMSKTSPVTQGIIVEMFTDKGTASILKNKLRISSDDRTEETILETDDDLSAALWEVFGIKVSGE